VLPSRDARGAAACRAWFWDFGVEATSGELIPASAPDQGVSPSAPYLATDGGEIIAAITGPGGSCNGPVAPVLC
jgi:hypothetical protein